MQETEFGEERAVIVACRFGQVTQWDLDSAFEEAESLTVTAGALPVGRLSQARALPDRRTFLGSGKAKELATIVAEVRADIVVVNHELSPSQQRNLQETVNCKVVD
ncbi:MAG: GTPase HflX, partial [Terriglobia bacterium]